MNEESLFAAALEKSSADERQAFLDGACGGDDDLRKRVERLPIYTEVGVLVGTLEYMSPEQAGRNNLDIDTRSDVYALGVVLYELLTGTTPLQRKRTKDAALWDLLRMIREEEPPRPSARLTTTEELPSIAANRGMEPKKLNGMVRGELDWKKDLLDQADIGNQAAGSERNRNITVRELLDRAAQGLETRFAGQERTEAAIRLTVGRAYRAVGAYAPAQKHMERAVAIRQAKLGPVHPEILEGMQNLAGLYSDRGDYGEARRLYEQVLKARRADGGDNNANMFQNMNDLGLLFLLRGMFDKAELLLQAALDARRAKLGPDHLETLESTLNLARLYSSRNQFHQAEPLHRRALEGLRIKLGPDHPRVSLR